MMPAKGGLVANRYELEALIGFGGMGEVFRARDRSLGETVAIKSIVLEGSDAVSALRRFREEVRLARRVTHRNVARVFDLVEDADGRMFLTMELIDGITLKALIERDGPLSPLRAARIGIDVCAGLSAVHAAGVVHRDLKPTNILVEETGRAVITDFGVARNTLDPNSLGLGMIVGTPHYMAPEQAEGRAVDSRADVYALGVTLLEMFAGRVPAAERSGSFRDAKIDPELRVVLSACIEHEPGGRPSPAEVAKVLELIADRRGLSAGGTASDRSRVISSTVLAPVPGPVAETTRSDIARGEHTLASSQARSDTALVVLPFRELGPAGANALGEVVAQELTDILSATRGLRVLATSAAARFRDDRDPMRIGRELSVKAVIDGTVRIAGEDIRMAARLIDAASGSQLWAETFEGSLGDLFSFESIVAGRVAEQLRAHVLLLPFDGKVPAEAVRCYLDARAVRRTSVGLSESMRLLERALELAPSLAPALAAHATVSMLAWFVPMVATSPDWEQLCAARVESALAGAPALAETHVAEGLLFWERGKLKEAASSLMQALRLAPTCADALMYLGDLHCKTGRTSSGLSHAGLCWRIDPTRFLALATLAREEAFAGRLSEAMARLDELGDLYSPPAFMLRVRAASWYGDEAMIRAWLGKAWTVSDAGGVAFGDLVARSLLGEAKEGEMEQLTELLLSLGKSPRFRADVLGISIEAAVKNGRIDGALSYLERLASIDAFADIDWLERCPGLGPLRGSPVFRSTLEVARMRASFTM
jgi:serine/threonine-protein kinase